MQMTRWERRTRKPFGRGRGYWLRDQVRRDWGGQGEICSRNGLLLHWDQQGVRIEARLAGKRKRRTRDAGRWRKKGKKEETARNGGGGKEE